MTVMPAGATAAAGRASRGRWVIILLAISLALNLCFVAGAAWTRLHPPNGAERFREMASALHLSPDQEAAFHQFARSMRQRTERMRQDVAPLFGDAWAEIAKPQADEPTIMRLLDQASTKRLAFQHDATEATLKFLATLSPEQREKFVTLARERRAPWLSTLHRSIAP